MRESAIARVRSDFSPERHLERLDELYAQARVSRVRAAA